MAKIAVVFFLVLAIVAGATAQHTENPPASFRILQYQCIALGWADFTVTSVALATGNFQEKNPIAKLYIHQPVLAVSINLAGEGLMFWGTTELWRAKKPLGWGLLVAVTAARAYVLARNIKTMKEYYRR